MKYIVSMGIVEEIKEEDVYANEDGKTFVKETCPRCQGTKIFTPWMHTYGGKCFKCDGEGYVTVNRKVYTSIESAQKVVDKYNKNLDKKQEEAHLQREENIIKNNAREKKEYGFENDYLYIVMCKYEDKETVKSLGSKWNSNLHFWTVQEPIQEFECLKITWEDVTDESEVWEDIETKSISFEYSKFNAIVEEYKDSKKAYEGEFIGSEKDKLELTVTLDKIHMNKNDYGYYYIYEFKDTNNNVLRWKTSKEMEDWEEGNQLTIKFTVKDHTEYENDIENKVQRQTNILRVKAI
jgi:hypothetical protein